MKLAMMTGNLDVSGAPIGDAGGPLGAAGAPIGGGGAPSGGRGPRVVKLNWWQQVAVQWALRQGLGADRGAAAWNVLAAHIASSVGP